ncbi:MAG TPA: hypothetical protein HA252_06530 [Candidatus Diapherotrites archaeon]|uniref:NFACT family protein n=1 Tax=Candidatus Iainarchaeum sp. TaxID=3101447 RepID=A0A7J4JGZ7_9ARCH|nr:NFACT family protein [Candidatus Diapherotrites archaeon]HIH17033.1 hypothetical protein [Candidatus Diapherotrites archaeon]
MQVPNLTLAYQVLALKPLLVGAFLNKVQRVSDKVFRFRFHSKQGSKDLVFNGSAFYVTSYKLEAQPSQGFAAFLKKRLYNKRVDAFYQQGVDRVLVVEFTDYNLVLELFADSNIVLADKSWKTLSALTYGEWKDRVIKRGQPYQFPASKGLNPCFLNAGQLRQQLVGPDLIRALISCANIAPPVAEEALALAGLAKTAKPSSLTEAELARLAETVNGFYGRLSLETLKPVYYAGEKLLLPFPLSSLQATPKPFASLDEAFDELFSDALSSQEAVEKTAKAETRQSKDAFNLGQQLAALKEFERVSLEDQHKAEAIYVHYRAFEEVLQVVREATAKGVPQKEILAKLRQAFREGRTPLEVVDLDLKKRVLSIELK